MTIRSYRAMALCGFVLAGGTCHELQAQEQGNKPAQVQPQVLIGNDPAGYSAVRLLADARDANIWNFVAFSHGNTLGVEIADVDAALRTQLGLEEGAGVVVTSVEKESAAAKAGLQQHDLVLKAGDQAIGNPKQFHDLIGAQQGKSVEFHVLRKGKPASVTISLPNVPVYTLVDSFPYWLADVRDSQAGNLYTLSRLAEQHYRIGVQLADADDALRSQLRLASGEGLVVTEVLPDTPAAAAGIEKNDVLTKLDGKRLTTVDAINTQIQEIKDRKVSLSFFRGGSERTLDLAPRLTNEPNVRYEVVTALNDLIKVREAEHKLGVVVTQVPEAQRIEVTPRSPVAEQVAALKKQLAELQKSLETLEASLQAAPAEKPANEEKK